MNTILWRLAVGCLVLCTAAPARTAQETAPRVKPIGSFTNVESDGEHEDGYSVHLWSHGQEIVGHVSFHVGLIGDAPAGVLTNVQFSRVTGELAFLAKLTSGLHFCKLHENVPSHDMLSFRGRLRRRQLRGTFTVHDHLDTPPRLTARDTVILRDDPDQSPYMRAYESVEAWQRDHARMLQRRGPKW